MKIDGKIRTSVWVHPSLILLLNERGMTLSSFISRSVPMFLDLPEDPREKLIQQDLEETVLRLRSTYENEVKKIVAGNSEKTVLEGIQKQKDIELMNLGNLIRTAPSYTRFEKCLKKSDIDDDVLVALTAEINKVSKKQFDPLDVWNLSVSWYRKYGALSGGVVV